MTQRDSVWFHEDDFCQIELLPKSAQQFAQSQARAIEEFSRAHDTGMGWTDIFVRKAPAAGLSTLEISLDDLARCVPNSLTRFDRVTTGYGTHKEPADHTVAWAVGGSGLIFANFDATRIVQDVFFAPFGNTDAEVVGTFLAACAKNWDLLLVHWSWNKVVELRDDAALQKYLRIHNERSQ